ncbi:MAG: tetratricopeptide repeat protein [Cytophagales bacterium]
MEALIFFLFPLFFYLALKIAIWRDVDTTDLDIKKYQEGIRMIEFGFIEEALVYFDKMATIHTKSMVVFAKRAHCHFLLQNYYQAIYNYDKAQSLSHDLPEVFLHKGICLYKIGDVELAYKEFNKAVWFYREKNAEAFQWRATTSEWLGNKEAAQKDFKKADLLRKMPATVIKKLK